jgi:UDP-glucose 4-epimerase
MNILITGGAGYIGSHTTLELLAQGHEVIIADNFSNSSPAAIERLKKLASKEIVVCEGDMCDKVFVASLFAQHNIDAAIHFAGFKAVGESVSDPISYYRNNIDSTLTLCEVMKDAGVRQLIFSSSASVYGDAKELPLRETSRVGAGIVSPYGRTKYMIEQILQDLAVSDPSWAITILRYFNPIGADKSGLIGEDPNGVPSSLLPYVSRVAIGKYGHVNVFGDDYNTPDGTCIRDYIHVLDLATGHVAALNHLKPSKKVDIYNLGTGKGVSVLEMIHAFEKASGKNIPYKVTERRAGDPSAGYADPSKAERELGWHATRTLEEACADSWKWQSQNPDV